MTRKEEMFAHINAKQASKISTSSYCDCHNLKQPTFYYWLKKYQEEQQDETIPNGFVELCPPANTQHLPVEKETIVIEYPNGVQVKVPLSVKRDILNLLINM